MPHELTVKGSTTTIPSMDGKVLDSLNLTNNDEVLVRFKDRFMILDGIVHISEKGDGLIALHPEDRKQLGSK